MTLEEYKALCSDNPQEIVAQIGRRGGVHDLPERLNFGLLHSVSRVKGEEARTIFIEMCRHYVRNAPSTTLGFLIYRHKRFKEKEVLLEVRNGWGMYDDDVDGVNLLSLEDSGEGFSPDEELERLLASREVRVLRTALRRTWRRLELTKPRPELTTAVGRLIDHADPIVSSYARAILREIGR